MSAAPECYTSKCKVPLRDSTITQKEHLEQEELPFVDEICVYHHPHNLVESWEERNPE
jgi:hypothetical protein